MSRLRKSRILPGDTAITQVNIVPVIDLCLVLLVILLVVSPMLEKPPIEVQLPKAQTKEEKENNISITLSPDGRLAVNADMVARGELPRFIKALLLEQGDDTVVIIRADRGVLYKDLTDLLKIAKEAGARRISLGTEQGGVGQ
jgi:biopolymer transport protein ExbD